jgi:hypothetical protein
VYWLHSAVNDFEFLDEHMVVPFPSYRLQDEKNSNGQDGEAAREQDTNSNGQGEDGGEGDKSQQETGAVPMEVEGEVEGGSFQ